LDQPLNRYPAALPEAIQSFLARRPYAALYRVPGRINLIGEHTDYNEGWVLPAASHFQLWFAVEPADVPEWRIKAGRFGETAALPLADCLIHLDHWSRFPAAVIHTAAAHQLPVSGLDLVFDGDLPIGSGLSSSSALTCGLLFILNDQMGWGLDPLKLAQLARESEQRTGVRGGIMDQYCILHALENHALLLDCRSVESRLIPLSASDWAWTIFDSGITHELVSSPYNARRASCERVVQQAKQQGLPVTALRDLSPDDLDRISPQLDPLDTRRAAFVLAENSRVHLMVQALEEEDFRAAGRLLTQSHEGLSYQYEVSCPEVDFIVTRLIGTEGVAGARIMGAGFGGSVLALIKKDAFSSTYTAVKKDYLAAFGIVLTGMPVAFGNGASREI
jgi:galactokinase